MVADQAARRRVQLAMWLLNMGGQLHLGWLMPASGQTVGGPGPRDEIAKIGGGSTLLSC